MQNGTDARENKGDGSRSSVGQSIGFLSLQDTQPETAPNAIPSEGGGDGTRRKCAVGGPVVGVQPESGREQYVYAFREKGHSGAPIKIGVSVDPHARLDRLQTGHPYQLDILIMVQGGFELEHALHRLLAPWRHKGEWFSTGDNRISKFLRELKDPDFVSACLFLASLSDEATKAVARLCGANNDSAFLDVLVDPMRGPCWIHQALVEIGHGAGKCGARVDLFQSAAIPRANKPPTPPLSSASSPTTAGGGM